MEVAKLIADRLRAAFVRLSPADGSGPPLPPAPTAKGVFEPAKAIDWHRKKTRSVTKEDWKKLSEEERKKAFTVAGVAQLDLVHDVWKALDSAIEEGKTLEDFKKEIGPRLTKAWAGSVKNPAARLEVIFRQNVLASYAAGRYAEAKASTATHPFWELAVVLDGRTSDVCRPVAGTLLPHDHPWWRTNTPQRHMLCRATIRPRTAAYAARKGVTAEPSTAQAQAGFGTPPDESAKSLADYVRAKIEDAPVELRGVFEGKKDERFDPAKHAQHATENYSSTLSDEEAQQVLHGVREPTVLALLEKRPIRSVTFANKVTSDTGKEIGGAYAPDTREVFVSTNIGKRALRSKLKTERPATMAAVAADKIGSLTRMTVHELGHFLHEEAGEPTKALIQKAWKNPKRVGISVYADEDPENYFAECYTAYVFNRRDLAERDPVGHALVKEVLEIAWETVRSL